MKTPNLPTESLEEIVFKTRNKAYGAYELRKKYQKYTLVSLFCAIFIIGGAISYPVVAAYLKKSAVISGPVMVTGDVMGRPPETPPPPLPPPPPATDISKEVSFKAPVVAKIDSVEGNLLTGDELNAHSNAAPPVDDGEPLADVEKGSKDIIEVPEIPKPVTWVPQMPAFPGGETAMYKFLIDHLVYTSEAREVGIQGTVYITFVVETDGSITDVKLLRGVGGGLDEEAIRVVKMMPKWSPGMNNGIPARVQFNLPVKFTVK